MLTFLNLGTLHVTEMRQEVVKKIVKEKKIVKSKIDIYIFISIFMHVHILYIYIYKKLSILNAPLQGQRYGKQMSMF